MNEEMLDYGEMKNNLLVYKSKEQVADICIAHYKEIERLNNIINELEKYGKQRFNEYEAWKEECKNLCYINGITEMLDKLQELKGSDKE